MLSSQVTFGEQSLLRRTARTPLSCSMEKPTIESGGKRWCAFEINACVSGFQSSYRRCLTTGLARPLKGLGFAELRGHLDWCGLVYDACWDREIGTLQVDRAAPRSTSV